MSFIGAIVEFLFIPSTLLGACVRFILLVFLLLAAAAGMLDMLLRYVWLS